MDRRVLITGASQGIGLEFAKLFARDKYDLVLLARDKARLEELAAELREKQRVKVLVLPKDLARPGAAVEIFQELKTAQVEIDVLVNNAGFGANGRFAQLDWQRHADLLQVNVTALLQLTHLFLPAMLARRSGKILNVASTAAFVPGPFQAMYYASKSFVHSFTQALAEELSGTGVTVTGVYPGVTRSQFHARAGIGERPTNFIMMEAGTVAEIGYRGLLAGKRFVVTGLRNKALITALKVVPVRLATKGARKANEPKQS